MKTAALGGIARVATHVAMALGASVHPFTKMTPSVSSTVMRRTGLEMSCSINQVNSISKTRSPFRQKMPAFPFADAVRHILISFVISITFLYYHRFSANSTCFFDFYESNHGILVKTEKIRNKRKTAFWSFRQNEIWTQKVYYVFLPPFSGIACFS